MTPDTFVALTPFGAVEVEFPEDGGSTLAGPPDAVRFLTDLMGRCTNAMGMTMTPQSLEPSDLVNFCQPPGSAVRIIPPADYTDDDEDAAGLLDSVSPMERARAARDLTAKVAAMGAAKGLERLRLAKEVQGLLGFNVSIYNKTQETQQPTKGNDMQDGQVTYTFADAPEVPAPLRGKTFTGGKLEKQMLGGKPVEVFAFTEKINGQPVAARVAGKPALEAAAVEIKAAIAKAKADVRAALEAAVPGLPQYEVAMRKWANAQAAYDRASERGYPAKEAAAAKAADAELQAVMAEYPATALWRKIEAYTQASNYSKSAAGDEAKKAVMAGVPIAEAVAKMELDWGDAANRAVMNS